MSVDDRTERPRADGRPGRLALDRIHLPERLVDPRTAVLRRIGAAVGLVLFVALVVFLGRDGYTDVTGDSIDFLDALYYASVTVTTTGYGDISAVTPGTRLATFALITPARILFLILVVGTTVEVLTDRYRRLRATRAWRTAVRDHFIVTGFGATGRSAAEALLADGIDPADIVVVDRSSEVVRGAVEDGHTAIEGDATTVAVLDQAGIDTARTVVVTPNRDDTAVLITLTARERNVDVQIVAAGRQRENLHLLRQSGADAVIDQSAAVGRLLGLATQAPAALALVDDLLDGSASLELAQTTPERRSDGTLSAPAHVRVLEVVRDGARMPWQDDLQLQPDDRLVVVRSL